MATQRRRPYLDKICSGPHLLSQRPGIREDTIVLIPSLRHTGIKTELHEQEIPVTNPEGRITKLYKQHTKKRLQPIFRDHQEFSHREVVFKKGHKQFIDKVLVEMEEKKRSQHERQLKHWRSSKSNIGFLDSFNVLNWDKKEKHNHQESNIITGQFVNDNKNELPSTRATTAASVATKEDEYGTDDDFEQILEDTTRRKSSGKEKLLFSKQASIEISKNLPPISPNANPPSAAQVIRSSSLISITSSGSHHSQSPILSPNRKSRPYSRMSLFENMLENMDPPKSPSKRFGSLADMTASFRDSFNSTANTQPTASISSRSP